VSIALRLAAAVGVIVAAAALLHGVVAVPESDMSASRVVPAVALARGFPLYAGPASGPIIDFMYGPIAALAFLPAALASTPSGALAIAVVVNVAWFFLPMAWLHVRAAGRLDVGLAALVLFGATRAARRLVGATAAQVAIISVGRHSMFGHPHKEVVQRWQSHGATVLTTGECGTITVTTDGKDLTLRRFIQPQINVDER